MPIRQSVTALETNGLEAATSVESFKLRFGCDTKPVWQSHFYLLGEEMVGKTVAEGIALVDISEIKSPGREDIGRGERCVTRAGKTARGTVSTGDIVAGDDDAF